MKVLWATIDMPDPTRGGGAAFEYELLRIAAADHDVTLLTAGEQQLPVAPAVAELGIEVERVRWTPPSPHANRGQLLWRTITNPMGLAGAYNHRGAAALGAAVRRAEQRQTFDLVEVWPGEMAEVAKVTSAPSALFCTDVHSRQRQRELDQAPAGRRRILALLELRKMRRWEQRAYPSASVVATVTDVDAAALRELTGQVADVVPLMIGDEWFVTPRAAREADLVTMIGALDYRPNVDAVAWLADEIWPRVRAARPTARLRIVGRNPVAEVRAAVERAGAELLADVPDVRPHYWAAAAVVAPIRLGSGMKNKILHAAACGAPQVATPAAVEGIDVEHGVDLLVAVDAEGFAAAVLEALGDTAGAARRAESAAAAVRRYRSDEVAVAFARHWERAAAAPRR